MIVVSLERLDSRQRLVLGGVKRDGVTHDGGQRGGHNLLVWSIDGSHRLAIREETLSILDRCYQRRGRVAVGGGSRRATGRNDKTRTTGTHLESIIAGPWFVRKERPLHR